MVIQEETIKLVDNLDNKKPHIMNNIHSKGLKKALISSGFFSGFSFADTDNSKESIAILGVGEGVERMSRSYFSLTSHHLIQACKLLKFVIVSNVALKAV